MSDLPQRLFAVSQETLTSDDYYTPAWVFHSLALTFDLDVCSPPGGVPWVPAKRFYTQADDGLSQPWTGRVWMNPPYSFPAPWVARFIQHANGVCLVPASNGRWFHDLWTHCDAMALTGYRKLYFVNGVNGVDIKGEGMPIRCILAAFGDECAEALSRIGEVRVRRSIQRGNQ